jgi:hypothetical protein
MKKPGIFEKAIIRLERAADDSDEIAKMDHIGGLVRQVEQRNASAYRDAARVLRECQAAKISAWDNRGTTRAIPEPAPLLNTMSEIAIARAILTARRRAEGGKAEKAERGKK